MASHESSKWMRFTSLEIKENYVLIKLKVMLGAETPIIAMGEEVVLLFLSSENLYLIL
jgi:hypothetical protein